MPPDAAQPGFHGLSTTFGIQGGVLITHRVAVTTFFDQTFGPGFSAAAGAEVLRGAHMSLNVYARYTTSEFDGLKVRRISVQIALHGRQ